MRGVPDDFVRELFERALLGELALMRPTFGGFGESPSRLR